MSEKAKKEKKWSKLRRGWYFREEDALRQKDRLEKKGFEVELEPSEKTSIKIGDVGIFSASIPGRGEDEPLWQGRFIVKYRLPSAKSSPSVVRQNTPRISRRGDIRISKKTPRLR